MGFAAMVNLFKDFNDELKDFERDARKRDLLTINTFKAMRRAERHNAKRPLAVVEIKYAGPDNNDIFWVVWNVLTIMFGQFATVLFLFEKKWLLAVFTAIAVLSAYIFRRK